MGWLATLHLPHFSAVSSRSYGEWILHSKLNLPALLAIHSAALARKVISPILLRLALHRWRSSSGNLAMLAAIRRVSLNVMLITETGFLRVQASLSSSMDQGGRKRRRS